ncbi:NAD(P)-dependent oxidoreductase [Klenkia sp. PcliD-1-E]|uniref:NAD(P)-dependent oxidoreductase n=1 Tax=Klenkia sp. PcliD-1-E TaxID=2954492 RepID=UPI002097DD91|nr:NAD(P)H-binding protein [Klenkia sp. PcliD-1-E]MCO7218281.1 NAD(P)H-binding protein [Klenkia sp. PcliD-1-E]
MTGDPAVPPGGPRHPRLLVLGANGPTGRRVVQQALDRGHEVAALTRHPEAFPIRHERLRVVAGDATDPDTVDTAVAATDAVICTIGAAFTRQPVQVYSTSARLLVESMTRHHRRRLLVVTSGGVDTGHQPRGALARLSRSVMRDHVGRTVYDDMEQMEATVSASDLDWTIVRPPGLTNSPGTGYAVADTRIDGPVMSRDDLAAMLLDHLDDDRHLRAVAAVTTPGLRVSAWDMLHHEVLKR